jgi:hypothetical protein
MAGYAGTPLGMKLGIKDGMAMALVDPPDNYWELVGDLPEDASVLPVGEGPFDFIHIFVKDRARLEGLLGELRGQIVPYGMIWVSWPKGSSRVPTNLDENSVRQLALASGLVDVKVCAVDETWSALKLVIRLRDRE